MDNEIINLIRFQYLNVSSSMSVYAVHSLEVRSDLGQYSLLSLSDLVNIVSVLYLCSCVLHSVLCTLYSVLHINNNIISQTGTGGGATFPVELQ